MSPGDVQNLIDYHYWAMDRMLAAIEPLSADQFTRDLGNSFGSVRDTLSHLHGAELIWLSRLQGSSASGWLSPARFTDLAAVRAEWADTEAGIRAFAGGLDAASLEHVFAYRLLNGQPARSRTSHVMQHLVNHGTYHRGQVTTMLRQLGAAPPKSVDLITYYREKEG